MRIFKGRRPTMTQFDGELSPPFEIVEPAHWRAPIIFNSPHSGSVYPHEFLNASRIDLGALRRSEDSFMDELIAGLSDRRFPTVRVNFPRSYVDVNREPYDLAPQMCDGSLASFGDRYGTSCAALLPDRVEETMARLGYSVGRNKPYAGGFITEHYGNPASGLHAIQIELNRAVYMDERRRERGLRFAQVAADFAAIADALATVPLGDLGPFQAAAD